MQLGLGTYAYAWAIGIAGYPPPQPMDTMAFLQRAADLGVSMVQIADNLPLGKLSARQLADLMALAHDLRIQVEVGTRGILPSHLRAYLMVALAFKSPILRVVVDTADHHPPPDEIVATLRSLMPEFTAAGVTLAIENHDRFKVRTLLQIIEGIDSPQVGICLDTVNSYGAGEGAEIVVETLAPYVVNLHVKDYSIRRHHHNLGFEVEGTPAGQGMLDMPWLLDKLGKHGRDFNAILETWPPPEPSLQQTIAKEDKWVVESIRYLRTLINS